MAGCLFRDFLNPFFAEEPRPINEDDAITICRNSKVADFQVRWMGPHKRGIVGPGAIIEVQKHAIEQGDADGNQTCDLAYMENPLEILKPLGRIIDHIPSNMHGSTIVDVAGGFQRLEQLLVMNLGIWRHSSTKMDTQESTTCRTLNEQRAWWENYTLLAHPKS
jgi:hypothetical protein